MNTVELGSEGMRHVLDVMDYDNFICRTVGPIVARSEGKVVTRCPIDVAKASSSVLLRGIASPCIEYLPAYLVQKSQEPGAWLILDDVMASPGDAYLAKAPFSLIERNGDVMHVIKPDVYTAELMTEVLFQVSVSWHFVCVCIHDLRIASPFEAIEALSSATISEVVVGAFDGDGYVHWINSTSLSSSSS